MGTTLRINLLLGAYFSLYVRAQKLVSVSPSFAWAVSSSFFCDSVDFVFVIAAPSARLLASIASISPLVLGQLTPN